MNTGHGHGCDDLAVPKRSRTHLNQPSHVPTLRKLAEAVAKVARVPMMLDESIFGLKDIERAADLGIASFIKLKLLKMGGWTAWRTPSH